MFLILELNYFQLYSDILLNFKYFCINLVLIMASLDEVEEFLRGFKVKMSIWVVFLDTRSKNSQFLIDLEMRPADRKRVLEELKYKDFSEGPIEDSMINGADMWVFGKEIESTEVYIKITLETKGASALCLSFHTANYSMSYPFK